MRPGTPPLRASESAMGTTRSFMSAPFLQGESVSWWASGPTMPSVLCGLDGAEQPVCFVVPAGGEEQRGRVAGQAAVAEGQAPQPVDGDRVPGWVLQLAEERAGRRVEGADPAVAEVAHQQVIAEGAETCESQGQAPGGGERSAGGEAADQATRRPEHRDAPMSAAAPRTWFRLILRPH